MRRPFFFEPVVGNLLGGRCGTWQMLSMVGKSQGETEIPLESAGGVLRTAEGQTAEGRNVTVALLILSDQ